MLLIIKLYELLNKNEGILLIILYSIPFLTLILISIFINNKILDISTNIILSVIFMFTMEYGDISAFVFIIFILYRLENIKQFIFIGSIFLLSFSFASIFKGIPTLTVFILIIGYLYVLAKYYYTIHKPTKRLHQRVKYLEKELFKLGPAVALTDDQIIQKYPFMYHPRDNKYRRIEDIRMLSDGLSSKEIAAIAEVEPNTISREFDDLKVNIGVFTDQKIMSKEQLIKVCIELGIIEVTFIHR